MSKRQLTTWVEDACSNISPVPGGVRMNLKSLKWLLTGAVLAFFRSGCKQPNFSTIIVLRCKGTIKI